MCAMEHQFLLNSAAKVATTQMQMPGVAGIVICQVQILDKPDLGLPREIPGFN